MMYASSSEDDQSLTTTSYAYRGSTRTNGSQSQSHPSRYSSYGTSASPIKYKGRPSNTELLFRLFEQRKHWRKYGELTVLCYESFIIAPVNLWWWMAEIFVLTTVMVFAYEFFYINWIILLPAVVIAILEWMAFYKTCMRDPGVMPKPPFVDALKNLVSVLSTWNGGPGTKRLVAHPNGQQEELHYCWRCHHFRSSQTSHCGTCDCCMMLHDHHCPVFGGCVAKNNTSSFHTMIITMGIFWLYMLGMCIYNMTSHNEKDYSLKSDVKTSGKSSAPGLERTPMTFYLIMAEILAIVLIPIIVRCTKEVFCNPLKKIHEGTSKSKETLVNEILKFAQANNFTLQERMQLMEVLQIQEPVAPHEDLNHNSFLAGSHVAI